MCCKLKLQALNQVHAPVQTQTAKTETTELSITSLTPPPASTNSQEKKPDTHKNVASGIRKQLFEGASASEQEPPAKKQKANEQQQPK